MDATALRLEKVRMTLWMAERVVDIRARRHLAVLAVELTGALAAIAAVLVGQLAAPTGLWLALALFLAAMWEAKKVGNLTEWLEGFLPAAYLHVDNLIEEERSLHDDGTDSDETRARGGE